MDFSALEDDALIEVVAGLQSNPASDPLLSAAIGALYDRFGRLVYTIAIRVVGDVETAEEITQDVFTRAWEGAHTYRADQAKVSSWLVSITRHRAIDELRRRNVRPEKDRVDWPEDVGMESVDGLHPLEGPEDAIQTVIQQQGIRQIIADMPSSHRQVLGLAYFQGLSHSQIADLLGEPLGTVKSRIRQAMQNLRDTLLERKLVDD